MYEFITKRLDRIEKKVDDLHSHLLTIQQQGTKIMAELDDLKTAVARETEVDESAIVLLNGLKAKLDAAIAAGDPAALKALSDSLGTESQKLADAVVANTPAA
jgi:uncharacterized protein YaaN involved in tellurite resistance